MTSQQRRYMSKRQRPCDFCRSRKTACRIDQAPPCRLCILHGRECTFLEAAAPRKRRIAVDEREMHEGTTRRHTTHLRSEPMSTSSPAQALRAIASELPPGEDSMGFAGDFNFDTTQSEFEALFRSPRPPATPSAASMRTLASIPRETAPQEAEYSEGANPQLMGLSSDMDPQLLRHYRFDENAMFGFKELGIHCVQHDPVPYHFLVSQQSLFSRRREEAGLCKPQDAECRLELENIIPAHVGKRLIRLFSQFISPQWPVISSSQPPNPATTSIHLLGAIYAISLPFAVHDDKLSVDVAYDKPPYPALSRIIDRALAYETHSPSTAVVQTLLLLVLRPSSDPLVADAAYKWDLLARLVACATILGLHVDPSAWSIAAWKKAERRRLAFFVYSGDKWLASTLGRPPLIQDDNWLVASLREGDLSDVGLVSEEELNLVRFADLTSTLGSVLPNLYSLRAINELSQDHDAAFRVAEPLLRRLQNIPTSTGPVSIRAGRLYVELIILRAGLRPWLGQLPECAPENPRTRMRQCTNALSDLIRSLNPDTDSVFWPPWTQVVFSSVCFTLMTMAVTSKSFEEASAWISDLQATRKSLRLKVASFPFLRLGLLRIDALFWRGISNVLHLEPHVAEAFKATEST